MAQEWADGGDDGDSGWRRLSEEDGIRRTVAQDGSGGLGGNGGGYIPPAGGGATINPNQLQKEFSTDPVLKNGLWGLATNKFGRRALDAAGAGFGNIKAQAIKGARGLPKNMGRKLRRVGVGAAGAIPLAMLAAGVGAATGDPSKAAALAMAAGSAGYNFSNFYGDKLAKGAGGAISSAKAGFWGEDFKKVQQYKFDQEFLQSPELMDSLTKSLGSRSAARDAIKNKDVQAFLNNNVTDPAKIAKALKLRERYKGQMGEREALQKSVAMAMWHRDINPGIFNPGSREQIAWKNNLTKQLMANGESQSQASRDVDKILDELQYFDA